MRYETTITGRSGLAAFSIVISVECGDASVPDLSIVYGAGKLSAAVVMGLANVLMLLPDEDFVVTASPVSP